MVGMLKRIVMESAVVTLKKIAQAYVMEIQFLMSVEYVMVAEYPMARVIVKEIP